MIRNKTYKHKAPAMADVRLCAFVTREDPSTCRYKAPAMAKQTGQGRPPLNRDLLTSTKPLQWLIQQTPVLTALSCKRLTSTKPLQWLRQPGDEYADRRSRALTSTKPLQWLRQHVLTLHIRGTRVLTSTKPLQWLNKPPCASSHQTGTALQVQSPCNG